MGLPSIPGAINLASLTGNEIVAVGGVGPTSQQCTTQQIADLGGPDGEIVYTPITTTVGGTITAAGIVGGIVVRTGPTAVFSDTTDTALAIVAAIPKAYVGQSFIFQLKNGTDFTETLLAGAGVTLTGDVVIPGESIATYLVTLTSLTAVTFQHISTAPITQGALQPAQFATASLSVGTLAAGAITGAAFVTYRNTGATPGAQTVRTAAQMLADFPGAYVGMSYMLRIINTGAGTFTLTADSGPTVTITGTATITQNVFRDYVVTFNTATTATIQSVGSGTSP